MVSIAVKWFCIIVDLPLRLEEQNILRYLIGALHKVASFSFEGV